MRTQLQISNLDYQRLINLLQKIKTTMKDDLHNIETLEAEIEKAEARKAELESLMADPELYSNQERWSEVSREYAQVERHLERAYQHWEEAQEAMAAIEVELGGFAG